MCEMRRLLSLAVVVWLLGACGSTDPGSSYPSPLPDVHVQVRLESEPSMPSGCCRLISSSDATDWVSAFCKLTVYGPDGLVVIDQNLWPAPAGLAIHPGSEQDAGKMPLSIDPVRAHYAITCQAVAWHGPAPK
jgi:hypothetical protein